MKAGFPISLVAGTVLALGMAGAAMAQATQIPNISGVLGGIPIVGTGGSSDQGGSGFGNFGNFSNFGGFSAAVTISDKTDGINQLLGEVVPSGEGDGEPPPDPP